MYCQSCKGNPYHRYIKEAFVQLCGFWLCKEYHEQALKKKFIVLVLRSLRESCISHCYDAIWS